MSEEDNDTRALAMKEANPTVVFDRVTKSFPESHAFSAWLKHRGPPPRRLAVSDVSLRIERGELFGLLGLNGAGKTTLLKVLCTLTLPDSGSVSVDGIDVLTNSIEVRRRIGYCGSDDRGFFWRLTARENLELFGALSGVKNPRLTERIKAVAHEVDLTKDLDRRYFAYSSGMRQRLQVARALLHEPPVLIFDEPTRAVDAKQAEIIRRVLRGLVDDQGKTVILATNIVEEAWCLCDRVAIIRHGRIVMVQSPETLTEQATDKRIFHLRVDRITDGFLARLQTLAGFLTLATRPNGDGAWVDVEIASAIPSLNEFLQVLGVDGVSIKSLYVEQPRPIDVFVKLVTSDAE